MRRVSVIGRSFQLWFLLVLSATARAEAPIPQLDTAGHTATIRDIAITTDGRHLISAGYDKVVRVWDLAKGETVRTLRGRMSAGREGEIYAMAVSPIAPLVAVGGYLDRTCPGPRCGDIRLFDHQSTRLVGLLSGHGNVVLSLAFSRNGRYLASTAGDDTVAIWDVSQRVRVALFQLPRDGRANRVAFMPDNRHVAAGSDDGKVRILDRVTGTIVRAFDASGVLKGLAVSGDGRFLAAGAREGQIHVWSWPSGQKLKTIENGSAVEALAFGAGPSIHHLVVGTSSAPYRINVWDVVSGSGDPIGGYSGHDNTVVAVSFAPAGTRVVTAGDSAHSIRIWSPSGNLNERVFAGGGAAVRRVGLFDATPPAVGPATDKSAASPRAGTYIAWGYMDPCPNEKSCPELTGQLSHALRLPTVADRTLGAPEVLTPDEQLDRRLHGGPPVRLRRAAHQHDGRALTREQDATRPGRYPKLILQAASNQQTLISGRGADRGIDHLSFTFDATGRRIISGGRNGLLESFSSAGGGASVTYAGHAGDVWGVTASATSRLLVSGSADHTVRLWNIDSGELLASLLHLDRDGNWVMWTPQGYYACSPAGDRLVGWHINKSREEAAEFVTARQVRKHFYRPEVVVDAILKASAIEAVRLHGLDREFKLDDLGKQTRPRVKILSDQTLAAVAGGRTRLHLDLAGHENSPVEKLSIYVNDTKVDEIRGPFDAAIVRDVPLAGGSNVIQVVVQNAAGENDDKTDVEVQGVGALDQRGTLLIIGVGVNAYPNKNASGFPRDLTYAVPDAKGLSQAVEQRLKSGHKNVETLLLITGGQQEPNRANIERVLDRLRQTRADDTVVLFIAGHGVNYEREGYFFLPTDARHGAQGWDSSSIVKWLALESALHTAKGRRILFVDTCQSAGAVNGTLIKSMADDEVVSFTAASREQDAWEFGHLGHGAFTYAVLQGLSGEADLNKDGKITVLELGHYISEKVIDLTKGKQEPDYFRPAETRDFVIVRN
jgi:WD40 repeat protein